MTLLNQAISNVVFLFVVSVSARVLADTHLRQSSATRLVEASVYWDKQNDGNFVDNFQNAITSLSFLQAARMIGKDDDLEKTTWVDLSRLERRLGRKLQTLRSQIKHT